MTCKICKNITSTSAFFTGHPVYSLKVCSLLVISQNMQCNVGTGALANNILEVLHENRGSTFFTGSDGSWESCPSIFNFIKQYNPAVQVVGDRALRQWYK